VRVSSPKLHVTAPPPRLPSTASAPRAGPANEFAASRTRSPTQIQAESKPGRLFSAYAGDPAATHRRENRRRPHSAAARSPRST